MSITPAGSFVEITATKTFSWSPTAIGQAFVIIVISEDTGDPITAITSGKATWTQIGTNQTVDTNEYSCWRGVATATGTDSATITTAAAGADLRGVGHPYNVTSGGANLTFDTFVTQDASVTPPGTTWPSITPGGGRTPALAFGMELNSGTAVAGSTSGWTYDVDSHDNGVAFAILSAAGSPVWADTDSRSVLVVTLYEASATRAPFTPPPTAVRGRPAVRKGSSAGPAPRAAGPVTPSRFTQPHRAAAGKASARKGTARAVNQGAPYAFVQLVPSVFARPHRAVAGRPAVRKGAIAGSPGAPWAPPGPPAPFAQPDRAVSGRPSARKGSAEGSPGTPFRTQPSRFTQPNHGIRGAAPRRAPVTLGSPGAPWTLRLPGAPFAQPGKATAGKRSARKGTSSGSAAPVYSPLVQETSGSTTGTTLTLTFPSPTTVSNGVVIAVCGYEGGSVSNITLGGTGSVFTRSVAAGGSTNTEIWAYPIIGQASTTIVITTTVGGIIAWAYEVSRWVNLDITAGNSGSGTSWSSGAAATTVPYPHFIVGCGSSLTSAAVTPTASGWKNEAAVTGVASGSGHVSGVSGWRAAATAGTFTYNGTASSGSWGAVTAAFLAVPPPATYNSIWCGYQFTEHAAQGYTGVTATVTLPSALPSTPPGALGSVWVGLGPAINQTGVYFNYNAAKAGGVETAPWSWWIPGAGERWDENAWPSGAGDSLTFSVQVVNGANWVMTITNNTRSWTYSETMSVHATNLNSWNTAATTPFAETTPAWIWPQNSAVVIVEKETANLPGYGSIAVTSVTTTPPYTTLPEPVFCINTAIDDYPGPFNMAAGSFTFEFNASA